MPGSILHTKEIAYPRTARYLPRGRPVPIATASANDAIRKARALQAAWLAAKNTGAKPRQKELAIKWGVTAGLISHYMNGREPLNVKWQLRFAEYLGRAPCEIWPDFPHRGILSFGLDADALDVALEYQELPADDRMPIRALIAQLARRQG